MAGTSCSSEQAAPTSSGPTADVPSLEQPTTSPLEGEPVAPTATETDEPMVVALAPTALDSGPAEVDVVTLASARAPGVAERAGIVFYAQTDIVQPDDLDNCKNLANHVYAFGDDGNDATLVAELPVQWVTKFEVDFTGKLFATALCGSISYAAIGTFDTDTMSVQELTVWQRTTELAAEREPRTGNIRWGPFVLDEATASWRAEVRTDALEYELGTSDSGRYRYYRDLHGFLGDETGPIDPDLRVMVEDTTTGEHRVAHDSPLGVPAWRFIFGPDDEVAWMTGNELGTAAVLARIDWSTGQIVEFRTITHPYWGYPLSGAGDPGPDAIAFESDGSLRAWSYTSGPGDPDPSTWHIETLLYPRLTGQDLPAPLYTPVPLPRLNSGLPATWLGITDRGEMVHVDTGDEQTLRSYGVWGDPTAPKPAEGSISYLDSAWQLPGTDRIYFTPCCEPAGGTGRYIDADDDTDVLDAMVSYSGFAAVPSPDATLVAIPQMFGLYLSEALPQPIPILIASSPHAERTSVAWLRDRRGLVWAPSNDDRIPTIEVIELDGSNAPIATRTTSAHGLTNITIAVRGDGAIVIAGCDLAAADPNTCEHSAALVLDPDSGEVIAEFAIEVGARLGGYDYSGTFLIYTDADGVARWRGGAQAGVLGHGFTWASW